jgi:long-chain acyl-CoA synthetase
LDRGKTAGLEEATLVAPGSLPEALDRLEEGRFPAPAGSGRALEVLAAAELALLDGSVAPAVWHRYLDLTRRREFLLALPDAKLRTRWAATAFAAIRASRYSLADLFAQRVASHPDKVFLQTSPSPDSPRWTYAQVARRLRALAAALASSCDGAPRVAIVAENGLDGACCDLACLVHGIFVAPLAPHLSSADLGSLLDRLAINVVVVDTAGQLDKIEAVLKQRPRPVRPFLVDAAASLRRPGTLVLGEEASRLDADGIDRALASLAPFGLDETATVLFTSGSTGEHKGVAFSPFHLLSKRFARAAALPFVGEDEVLLCYLPLYHTFGRFLELLGTLFWGGTYVFAGNPSLDTYMAGLRRVRPTGLVGIPARWAQLHDRCQQRIGAVPGLEQEAEAVREITGGRLSWGLSAAGYLDPSVFRFFQRSGVALCSGFGMTEATGGITMSPPGGYEDGTVGIPLPGIDVLLDRETGGNGPDGGELLISGPYVARDLDDEGPPDENARWVRTGDIFRRRESGSFEIIDRVKDIFKNSRGQTVAPRRVEQIFEGVPGFRRTFLAGDGRDDNVLLVVPDPEAPLLSDLDDEERQSYFKRIVAEANLDLAPHERVVGFAVLDRDFSPEMGELTPKGSYRRKVIEENFGDDLLSLYQGSAVTLANSRVRVRVPRWLHRDVGILEGDLELGDDALEDRRRGLSLILRRTSDAGAVRIGDLEYTVAGDTVDLGILARQPLLWLGNPSLAAFFPLKGGWDTPPGAFSFRVRLPASGCPPSGASTRSLIPSPELAELNRTVSSALFGDRDESLEAVRVMEDRLRSADPNTAIALRRRFETLALHPDTDVRCAAYRILLLDEPAPGAASNMESFLESGLPFLSADSIETIARAGVPGERLTALRRRLQGYRVNLPRPFPKAQAGLLSDLFVLLARHARRHREDFAAVRSELACWSLEETEPRLAGEAETLLNELSGWHTESLPKRACFRSRLAFHEGLPAAEREGLERLFDATGFLEESLDLACGEAVTLEDVGPGGIWIAPVATVRRHRLYRTSINTLSGRHSDFLLIVGDDLAPDAVRRTKLWMEALASPADGSPVVPAFGCYRKELRALSIGWVDEPTLAMRLWELEQPADAGSAAALWKTLFVRALAAFFSAWEASGRRLIPGSISPANVVVPRYDFHEGTVLLSLAGHHPYDGPCSLASPMVRNFFMETFALYPHSRTMLRRSWIADACVEALGLDAARAFLDELVPALRASPGTGDESLADDLEAERRRLDASFQPPLALLSAVARFEAWETLEPDAPFAVREAMARGLERVYRLDRFPEVVRYHLHRQTTFSGSSGPALRAFDALLDAVFRRPSHWPAEMVELADVQAALEGSDERLAFGRLVFPNATQEGDLTLAAVGDGRRHLVTTTRMTDRTGAEYSVRDPLDPGELGRLVQLLVRSGVPRKYFEGRRHLVVLDEQERVVAGVSYTLLRSSAQLDGIAVTPALRGRGLCSALLDDLCSRLRGLGVDLLTRHLAFRDVPLGRAFRYDQRWRCLVRRCNPD